MAQGLGRAGDLLPSVRFQEVFFQNWETERSPFHLAADRFRERSYHIEEQTRFSHADPSHSPHGHQAEELIGRLRSWEGLGVEPAIEHE
jgi:hypothetical protein